MRSPAVLYRSAALAFAVSLSLVSFASGRPAAGSSCRRVPLTPAPAWIGSAAWSADGSQLVLTDPLGPSLVVYGEDGRFLRRVDGEGSAPSIRFSRPAYLSPVAGGFLLLDAPPRLLWLDGRYEPVRSVDDVAQPGLGTVGALFSWAATSRSTIYGYGDLETSPQQWRSGYLRLTTSPDLKIELLRETTPQSPEHGSDLCRATYPCAASAGDAGYFLVQVDPPRIERAITSLKALASFPETYRRLPKLPRLGGAQGFPRFMRALEQSALAVAIYGRGEHVFVLTRKPLGGGKTRWELVQIDPRRDAIVGTKVLPTTARHLTIAPGSRFWALIEKGSVVAAGEQAIESLLLVPTSWIESTTSPLAAAATPPRCEAAP